MQKKRGEQTKIRFTAKRSQQEEATWQPLMGRDKCPTEGRAIQRPRITGLQKKAQPFQVLVLKPNLGWNPLHINVGIKLIQPVKMFEYIFAREKGSQRPISILLGYFKWC